jgi:hypothetical protein
LITEGYLRGGTSGVCRETAALDRPSLSPARLQIDDLGDILAAKDVMVSPDAKREVEGQEQLEEVFEPDVGV